MGIIALLDERFLQYAYRQLFPREWENFEVVSVDTVARRAAVLHLLSEPKMDQMSIFKGLKKRNPQFPHSYPQKHKSALIMPTAFPE